MEETYHRTRIAFWWALLLVALVVGAAAAALRGDGRLEAFLVASAVVLIPGTLAGVLVYPAAFAAAAFLRGHRSRGNPGIPGSAVGSAVVLGLLGAWMALFPEAYTVPLGVGAVMLGGFSLPAAVRLRARDRRWASGAAGVIMVGVLLALFVSVTYHPHRPREKAYQAMMKADLRNLQSAQEIYYGKGNYHYASSLDELELPPSDGVTIEIARADSAGFAATAMHEKLPGRCGIFSGGPGYAVHPAEEPGVVACEPLPEIRPPPGNVTFVGAGLVGGYLLTFGLAFWGLAPPFLPTRSRR